MWKASLGLSSSVLSVIAIVPVRSLDTKKIAPPPSLAWLWSISVPATDSVIVSPSL